jgi:hypothetical protein
MPSGQWIANETVLRARNLADSSAGRHTVRPWTFVRKCETTCWMVFLRGTLYGPSATMVMPHRGYYTAAFPPVTTPCPHYAGEYAGVSYTYSRYTLWWPHDGARIYAISQSRAVGGNCPGGAETVESVATRTDPKAQPLAPGP